MLELNGKADIKLIQNMVDVAVVPDRVLYNHKATAFDNGVPYEKSSRRGNYELEYVGFIKPDRVTSYTVRLWHFDTIIYEYEAYGYCGKVTNFHIESDSDRNAVNTLIKYMGLPVIRIFRKNYVWYAQTEEWTSIEGDIKLIDDNLELKTYELNYDDHYTRWGW